MLHFGSRISARATVLLALLASAAMAGVWGMDAGQSEASHAGGMSEMSIDLNTTGNTASGLAPGHVETLGAIDPALAVSPCDSVTLDVAGLDVPVSNPMIGFGFKLNSAPTAFTVTASDSNFLLAATAGSEVIKFDDAVPSDDGDFITASGDLSGTAGEAGSGVLERITIEVKPGAPPSGYNLTLTEALHIDSLGGPFEPDTVHDATVTVTGSCNGDVDCSITVNAVDALKLLRHSAGLSVSQTEPCANVNTDIGSRLQGDVDCSGGVSAVDALKIRRATAGLSGTQAVPCPPIDA